MPAKRNWDDLPHEAKIELLNKENDADIAAVWLPPAKTKEEFLRQLASDRVFWNPSNLETIQTTQRVPSKEITIGASRDLTRVEALLELIDNSIDAWMRRRAKYPRRTASALQIYIDVDDASKTLIYEDNAGGLPKDKLINLVIPGFSDTGADEATIGSYRTGGKKAVFKLASEANIRTWYWNPVGTSDEGYEVHLDDKWLTDAEEYKFPFAQLKSKIDIESGQTIYKFRLKEILVDGTKPWYKEPEILDQMVKEIQRTYTLMLLRNPEIEIYFIGDRLNALHPVESLYKFTGYEEKKGKTIVADLRPQQVFFEWKTELLGKPQSVRIEVVLGCRTTTGIRREEDTPGIDLYGNNRLFVLQDEEFMFDWFGLKGAGRQYARGFINLHGPNVLIPWDTHKRHLNAEREVLSILKRHKLVREYFGLWKGVYSAVQGNKQLRDNIKKAIDPWMLKEKQDLNIPHSFALTLPTKNEGKLPDKMHKPVVPKKVAKTGKPSIKLEMKVSQSELRRMLDNFQIKGSPDDREVRKQLIEAIKETALTSH
jgi:hypothetical protein